jgi:pimeloyl-ACP methyl ester carboxylesterase
MIKIDSLVLLNFAIAYEAYRPVLKQKLLNLPIIGSLVATLITKQRLFKGINSARGANKLSAAEFEALWSGISRENGQKLSHRHIRYNRERNAHARRWETALFAYRGPTKLVWGLADPVSGEHVLKLARPKFKHLSKDDFLELPDVGHFPQSEASAVVAQAIRSVAS